jgi:hypothetical protein
VTSGGQTPTNDEQNPLGVAQTSFLFLPPIDGELALQPRNTMTVTFWPLTEGMDAARSYSWFFNAA